MEPNLQDQPTIGLARAFYSALQRLPLTRTLPKLLLRWRPLIAGILSFLLAYKAFDVYHQSRFKLDDASFWLGLSLISLAVAVWDGGTPRPTTWPSRVARLVWTRRWELTALVAVVAFAVFMRAGRLGDFPPPGLLTFEEHINGAIAYAINQGDRPLIYPFEHYGTALGFELFGETASAQRLMFVIAGIITVIPFYILLREFVRPPAALFVTVLFAGAPVLIDTSSMQQWRILAMVLFFYLLVRGTRSGSSLPFLGAGVLAALLSYEWDAFKPVPIVGVAFLGTLGVKHLAWPPPQGVRELVDRSWGMIMRYWRPAVAFFGAAGIVLVPLLATELDQPGPWPPFYITPLDRHAALRDSLLPDDWFQRVKWAADAFLPFGSETLPAAPFDRLPMLDIVTSATVTIGVVLAVVAFYRPYRLLFVPYFLIGLVALAVLSDRFWTWRLVPLLPVGLILVAFAIEDLSGLAFRIAPRVAFFGVPLALAGLAAFAGYSNFHTWFEEIPNERLLREYGNFKGQGYALCDYLRDRGRDSFSYVLWGERPEIFSQPHSTLVEQKRTFGDFIWICHDLQGTAVAAPQEAWPLRPQPRGDATLVFVGAPMETEAIVASLAKALPDKPQPDRIIQGPLDTFTLLGYELSKEQVESLQGLQGRYEATADGRLLLERVDDVSRLAWDELNPPPVPFTARWQGVVYYDPGQLGGQLPVYLQALSDDPAEVTVDGDVSFSSLGGAARRFPRPLATGWHAVEVKVAKTNPSGSLLLRWLDSRGDVANVQRGDLFPLRSLSGWSHQRTLRDVAADRTSTVERLDFEPYFASDGAIRNTQGGQVEVVSEDWSAVWRVEEAGEYRLEATALSGALQIKLDGAIVLDLPPERNNPRTDEVALRVPSGDHRLEVLQLHDGGWWTGARVKITDPNDPGFSPDLSPF